MGRIIYICFALILIACKDYKIEEVQSISQSKPLELVGSFAIEKVMNKYVKVEDKAQINKTNLIPYDSKGQFGKLEKYYKKELKYYPELRLKTVIEPYLLYENRGNTSNHKDPNMMFDSESGIDNYFLIYSAFLERINGLEKFNELRKSTGKIYDIQNSIEEVINGGGSAYGHNSARNYANFEFSLYNIIKEDTTYNYIDSVNNEINFIIKKQNFIKSEKDKSFKLIDERKDETIEVAKKKVSKLFNNYNEAIKNEYLLNYSKTSKL